MRKRNILIATLVAGPVLGGCTSDPAFWSAMAEGLDQAAYELATECTWYTDRFGVLQQGCPPTYPAATYYDPAPRYRVHDRDRDRDHRHRRDRDGRRDNDRDDRRDRDGHDRRGPKGEG